MSAFGRNENGKKIPFSIRVRLLMMKVNVIVTLLFFKEVKLIQDDVPTALEKEIREWASEYGLKLSIKEFKKPNYANGHHCSYLCSYKICKELTFSK